MRAQKPLHHICQPWSPEKRCRLQAAGRLSRRQRAELWDIWDARNGRLEELRQVEAALRTEICSVLQQLELNHADDSDYSDLLDAGNDASFRNRTPCTG